MNLYLLLHGYTLVTLKGDNDKKLQYYKALEKSHTEHEPNDFYILVAEAEKEALQRYIQIIKWNLHIKPTLRILITKKVVPAFWHNLLIKKGDYLRFGC